MIVYRPNRPPTPRHFSTTCEWNLHINQAFIAISTYQWYYYWLAIPSSRTANSKRMAIVLLSPTGHVQGYHAIGNARRISKKICTPG
jgi:hypothetical protein